MVSTAVLSCPSELRFHNAAERLRYLLGALAEGVQHLDLSALSSFDSSALAVLLAVRRELGSAVQWFNPPPQLRALAALYGVETVLFDSNDGGGDDAPMPSD